jgi:hypothetical protein
MGGLSKAGLPMMDAEHAIDKHSIVLNALIDFAEAQIN